MKPIVIIANPASGKDIRRLVAHGTVISNMEKVNIVRRVLTGLDAMGVEKVFFMPERYGIGKKAMESLNLSIKPHVLDMLPDHVQDDSTCAAGLSVRMGAACLIVLGGDGTNRVVAKASGDIPLLSIATGTNNVFSTMIEGTLAGIAAGIFARDDVSLDGLTFQAPRLEIWRNKEILDMALVDVVISNEGFVASRALWQVDNLTEVFLTRAEPHQIGFSSLGGYLCHLPPDSGKGLHIRIGPGNTRINAPIAPGLVKWVPIESYDCFKPGDKIPISGKSSVIALDGEREIAMRKDERLYVTLSLNGPRVVKLKEALQRASETCLLVSKEIREDRTDA